MPQGLQSIQSQPLSWRPAESRRGAVLRFPVQDRAPAPARAMTAPERRTLDALRRLARESCLACRPDCPLSALAAPEGKPCPRRRAAERFRAFLEAADRRVTLYRPGAGAASPDELWLLRLSNALLEKDFSCARSLIAFRVEQRRRRAALAEAAALMEPFSLLVNSALRAR